MEESRLSDQKPQVTAFASVALMASVMQTQVPLPPVPVVAITQVMQPLRDQAAVLHQESSTMNMNTMTTSKRMDKRYANVDLDIISLVFVNTIEISHEVQL